MLLLFRGGVETVALDMDRKNKVLAVTSTKTNNKEVYTKWNKLFDKGKEEEQEKITDTLSDKLFIKVITTNMNKHGYILINSKC